MPPHLELENRSSSLGFDGQTGCCPILLNDTGTDMTQAGNLDPGCGLYLGVGWSGRGPAEIPSYLSSSNRMGDIPYR